MNNTLKALWVGGCLAAMVLGCGRGEDRSSIDRKSIVIEQPAAKGSRPGTPPPEGKLPEKFRR